MGFAAKAVNLRRLQMSPDVEREWKKLCREARHAPTTYIHGQVLHFQVEIWKQLPAHPNIVQRLGLHGLRIAKVSPALPAAGSKACRFLPRRRLVLDGLGACGRRRSFYSLELRVC